MHGEINPRRRRGIVVLGDKKGEERKLPSLLEIDTQVNFHGRGPPPTYTYLLEFTFLNLSETLHRRIASFGDSSTPPLPLLSSASHIPVPTLVELESCVRFLSYQSFQLHLTRSLAPLMFYPASPELQPSAPAVLHPVRFAVQMSVRFPAQQFPPHPVRLNHPDLPAV